MRRFFASFIVMICVGSFTVGPVAATDEGIPNHPKLLNPAKDRIVRAGFLPDQTGVWKERVFPNDLGNHTALCLENLTTQRVFPGAAPARGEGVFCLWDLKIVGANEYVAPTASLSGCLQGGESRQLVKFANCHVFFEGGSTTSAIPRRHVVSCPSENGGSSFFAPIITTGIIPNSAVVMSGAHLDSVPEGPGPCASCDPVVCDPCCASCPDE